MEELGYIVAKVLHAIFKDRPNCAYAIVAILVAVVLGTLLLKAKDPNDFVFPIIGLAFLLVVAVGHLVRANQQENIQEVQATEVQISDEETTPDREIRLEPEVPVLGTEDHLPKAIPYEPVISKDPGISAGESKQFVLISTVFLFLGYILTYLFGTKILLAMAENYITGWDASTTEFAMESTLDPFIQLLCGLPCTVLLVIPVIFVLRFLLKRFLTSHPATVLVILAMLGFITGIVIFAPMQMLLLLLYTF